MTITSVTPFPLLVKIQGLLFMTKWPLYGSNTTWPTCFMVRNSDVHLYPFFQKYFHEIFEMNSLLTYYRWYDWLTEGREIRSDRKWLSYYQQPYFWKKNFINSKWFYGHLRPDFYPKNSPSKTLPFPSRG